MILFDARSDDGLMAWNILDPVLGATPAPLFYPVLRTMETVATLADVARLDARRGPARPDIAPRSVTPSLA